MAADGEPPPPAGERIGDEVEAGATMCYLHKFKLYETTSKFYMIGRDKSRTQWRVLKIDRLEPSELSIREDSTTYSTNECHDLLKRIHEGNMPSGGLKFVTNCYGIVGFIKFLGPYYMLLITKRRPIGSICGHTVYAITKSTIISISNSTARSEIYNSKNENRYKKLLCSVDLTKDFFFSYSYHVMRSLQKNLCDNQKGQVVYETMFVWNEFLTRGIRNHLKSTLWTVALVYGFFKQAKLRVEEKEFKLTLIARRSRHYAGTRYLKRGINEKGRVANDVETEQIVFEDVPAGCPAQITSIIQNRGSIPLFWSQETSKLNIKPDIVLLKKDQNYEATRLHFENLVKRYGNPIIIMNLIKTRERKPRESKLRAEFANAINFINKDLSGEDHLRFLHWDLSRHAGSKATSALALLGKVATYALTLTGFFYCQVTPALRLDDVLTLPIHGKDGVLESDSDGEEEIDSSRNGYEDNEEYSNNCLTKHSMFQNGVLRTNCIDCLDRTNVAQYAYGLAALGRQLHRLGLIDEPKIDLDDSLADDLMNFYETMGDTLALQYTGSAAHNKIFSERRGHWKAAVQSQEFFRTLRRYYSNAYMDAEKQDAINIFLGHFQPQQDKPALWELESDQHCNVGRQQNTQSVENSRTFFRGSLSDGNILREGNAPISGISVAQKKNTDSTLPNGTSRGGDFNGLSDIAPEIPARECDISFSFSRYTPSMISRQLFVQHSDHICSNENRACESNYSNFLDLDWLSPSGNSCEEEMYEMSSLNNSSLQGLSSENVINVTDEETASQFSESRSSIRDHDSTETALLKKSISGISGQFVNWVMNGGTFYN